MASSSRTVGACRQCHDRKVKCNRAPKGCGACQRFGLRCSIVHHEYDVASDSDEAVAPGPLTQGRLKRRRAQTACNQCHRLKTRCSGDTPCTRCRTQDHDCTYTARSVVASRPSSEADRAQYNMVNEVPALAAECGRRSISKSDARRYLEAYFEQNDSAGRVFLHKASVMADYHQDRLDPLISQALCGFGSRLCSQPGDLNEADEIMSQVEATVLARPGDITLSRLQALTLLLHYRRMSAKRNELWILLSVAARMAFTLCLNYENPDLSPVRQECNRRLMWSIYLLDSLGCGGLDTLAVCPLSYLQIRLPCDEHSYAFGSPSLTARLNQAPVDSGNHLEDAFAKTLRLMPIRHQILKYSRKVIASGQSPWATRAELEELSNQLYHARANLPEELQSTEQNLTFRSTTSSFTSFVMLHAHWYQMVCDLYRFLIPGKRESVSSGAFAATPSAYVTHCQERCLKSAQDAVDFFIKIYELPERKRIDDSLFGVIAYHSAHILTGGPLLVAIPSRQSLRTRLEKMLLLVKESEGINTVSKHCSADLKRSIAALSDSADIASKDADDETWTRLQNPEYVFVSKHSTLPVTQQDPQIHNPMDHPVSATDDNAFNAMRARPSCSENDRWGTSNDLDTATVERRDHSTITTPLWRPADSRQEPPEMSFADSDIFGLYNFGPDSTYYIDPFDFRFDTV